MFACGGPGAANCFEKEKRDRERARKETAAQEARKARDSKAFFEQWASEEDRRYYGDMRRGGMYGYQDLPKGTRYNQQGRPYDSQNQRQRGSRDSDRSYRRSPPPRTWFTNEWYERHDYDAGGYYDAVAVQPTAVQVVTVRVVRPTTVRIRAGMAVVPTINTVVNKTNVQGSAKMAAMPADQADTSDRIRINQGLDGCILYK